MNILTGDIEGERKVPSGKKDNVFVVLDHSENLNLIKNKNPPKYWDDCGAWDYKKSRTIKTKFLLGDREDDGGHKLSHVTEISL